jgi:hypothetical protein
MVRTDPESVLGTRCSVRFPAIQVGALSVVDQSPTGFLVEANAPLAALLGKGESEPNGAFNWRVVAKRKDIKNERLERVTLPAVEGALLPFAFRQMPHAREREIAASAHTRHITVVIATGSSEPLEHVYAARVLRKPVTSEELINVVRSCLTHQPRRSRGAER